jgi:hypothetical protein
MTPPFVVDPISDLGVSGKYLPSGREVGLQGARKTQSGEVSFLSAFSLSL